VFLSWTNKRIITYEEMYSTRINSKFIAFTALNGTVFCHYTSLDLAPVYLQTLLMLDEINSRPG